MRTFRSSVVTAVLMLLCFAASFAQQQPLTLSWMYGKEGSAISRVPSHEWLDDNTALLYDTRPSATLQTFERFDPAHAKLTPVVDMAKALASLKTLGPDLLEDKPLEWPKAIDRQGDKALFIFKDDVFLLDFPSSSFTRLTNTPEEEKDVEFSPDGRLVSFVRNNDLCLYDLASHQEKRLTQDGTDNLRNGTLTWVYWEEIFGRHDIGYWWSPDSKSIAYLQTDVTEVPVSIFVDFAPVDQRIIRQHYPKPGEQNPKVRVGVVDVADATTHWIKISDHPYEWTLRVKWLPDSSRVSIITLDRPQTREDLYFAPRAGGEAQHILTENDPAWVNVNDDLTFLADGKQFLWASERDGYMHLYRYRMDGTMENKITNGDWAVASSGGVAFWVHQSIVGVDEKNGWVYFTALKDSSIERHLYRINLDGSGLRRIDEHPGMHGISMAPDTHYYFDTFSDIRTLPSLQLHSADGKLQQVLSPPRTQLIAGFGLQYPELLTIPAADGFPMPAPILKPKDFNPAKKYPVILHIYGGPSAPTVKNQWQPGIFYDNLLLRQGYIVVGVDNRSATAISKRLESTILLKSPAPETADQLAGVKWLKSQPWVDGNRVGVWGWSGGGTMTLSLMIHSQEFKAGIAGAPVTDWRYYDSKWAEAFMKLPQDHEKEYDDASLVKHAAGLHGMVLLIYGTYDDNVHPQNEQAFMNALIQAGKPYKVMLYPMRKHGFTDRPAKIHRDQAMLDFWKENL